MNDRQLENKYQQELRERIELRFPGCLILKNDANLLQGIPDLVVFWHDRYAFLEVKPRANAVEQPNQRWYIETIDRMSFAAFICPENEEEVLDALQRSFTSRRSARVPQRL